MESRTGTEVGAGRLRRLNAPERVEVRRREGIPTEVWLRGRWRSVSQIEQVWRIEEGWWRAEPVRRTYFQVALDQGGMVVTVFQERDGGSWWAQRY